MANYAKICDKKKIKNVYRNTLCKDPVYSYILEPHKKTVKEFIATNPILK
jgi:hypothetical protein